MYISDIINRSSILKNSWHFRGLCLDKEVAAKLKPNDVIEHKNFASSSISALITYEFVASARSNEEGILLVFRNTAKKHGIFIDSLSAHRGKEQEVLFNVGSDFKLIRKLGYYHEYDCPPAQIWLAELVENKDCKLRKYSYQSDIAEKLVATIQMSDLMKSFYISYVIDANMWDDAQAGLVLKRYNSEDITIDIRYNMGTLRIEFCGLINEEYSFKIKEKGYNHMFDYIYGILKTRNITSRFSTSALSSFSEKFMFDLISCFTNNHYIITDQSINKGVFESPFGGEELFADLPMKTVKESRLSEFTLLTADAKPLHIELELSLSDDKREILADLKVPVGNRKGIKHFSISVEKRFELFDIIFTSIVSKFNLDPSRRIKHIFSLVSGYYESYLDFRPTEQGYKCSFDDKVFEVLFEGESIRVVYEGASILFDYYEDIYSAASEIQAMI